MTFMENGYLYHATRASYMWRKMSQVERSLSPSSQLQRAIICEKNWPLCPSKQHLRMLWLSKLRSLVIGLGNLSKEAFKRRASTGSKAFSHVTCLNATKIVLLSVFPLISKICRKFWLNHCPMMQKARFQFTRVAQKSLCLSSLLSRLDRVDPARRAKVFIRRKVGPARRVSRKGGSLF